MSKAQATEDLLKLDPNVALRLGLSQGRVFVGASTDDGEMVVGHDEEDLDALIEEEEADKANDPMRKLLNTASLASTKTLDEDENIDLSDDD